MSKEISAEYDVVVMGGGPAGATLGAILARRTDLSVAIFEKERFPREHIGESFAHTMIPALEQSGALPKVLASECWIKKFGGGVFNWGETPMVAFFDQPNYLKDGVHRFAIHVNRSEFDDILLKHAADVGVDVFEETPVSWFSSDEHGCTVTLKDGTEVRAKYFVDASGRRNSIAAKQKREWLSGYRNIAIWQHFLGGKNVQSLPGDWNIFASDDLSPIGCFAFRDGWCWYIPVPKVINGERRVTHSIGIVTIPEILKQDGYDFTDQKTFLETVKEVPYLKDLIADVEPVADKMLTATNYSMINGKFSDFDERWLLAGDASYFVDPLFSSGAGFAVNMAANAAMVLEQTLSGDLDEQSLRDLWRDYDDGWHGMAENFALSIDQWYHALGNASPDSIYWSHRGSSPDLDIQERTFDVLINTAVTAHVLQNIVDGPVEGMAPAPVEVKSRPARTTDPFDPDTVLSLHPEVRLRQSVALDVPGFKGFLPAPPFDEDVDDETRAAMARYWADPVANGDALASPVARPVPAYRFAFGGTEIRGLAREGSAELLSLLSSGVTAEQLNDKLSGIQHHLFQRLVRAGMVIAA
ncbi:NAD(P)/FAD-dependent oxidoreductase [Lentzea sp. BCCO 10_0798]|uniref:NAD(P)/FAD-dependent oxidoreductase n=1 Tax=Lentzea kristufekii TaxID=3095430 RepID=A0ABU4TKV1_9PSEU|nr:NAD(P)/FAD-dependent oxidoreductase [Lentzea sp. BCCO 10_0798]MDX8048552.1 NAD(P)/FAD-dependent oxidoreductase [Lentzea sp. BCCO 10_0798]